ncbi:hypothetical protein Tco_0443077 [Tanacetum coccineum]
MLNDKIKASAEYSEYLTKAGGSILVVRGCKGLLSKKGVEIAVEQIKTAKDEEPLIRRQTTGIVFSEEVHRDSNEERLDHSMKLKGLETLFEVAQLKLDIKKARKASKDDFFIQQRSKGSSEGSGVPDEPEDSSNNSSISSFDFEFAVEDISSDEAEVTEKADNTKIADAEKDTTDQVADEQVVEK